MIHNGCVSPLRFRRKQRCCSFPWVTSVSFGQTTARADERWPFTHHPTKSPATGPFTATLLASSSAATRLPAAATTPGRHPCGLGGAHGPTASPNHAASQSSLSQGPQLRAESRYNSPPFSRIARTLSCCKAPLKRAPSIQNGSRRFSAAAFRRPQPRTAQRNRLRTRTGRRRARMR